MNREIKFRGKYSYNGEWVFGSLLKIEDNYHIVDETVMCEDGHHIRQERDIPTWVKPDTIGQFTGLYDKNGKEIYEGDILRFSSEDEYEKENFVAFEVFWHDNDCAQNHIGWQMNRLHFQGCICGYSGLETFLPKWTSRMEIIGNIHDNTELMK